MSNWGIIFTVILVTICFVIELLPVISVPLTSMELGLYLCDYKNFTFGIFGICDKRNGLCSSPKIGYPTTGKKFSLVSADGDNAIELPSSAVSSVSKLLVVHVISFGFTCFLLIGSLVLIATVYLDKKGRILKLFAFSEDYHDEHIVPTSSTESQKPTRKDKDITPILDMMLFFGLIAFLLSLLAFLSDLLLFIPEMTYLGWLQLVPVMFIALALSILCFAKRTISSRKYLEMDNCHSMDDMKASRREISDDNDSASDDGFYVYTNGFYSNYDGIEVYDGYRSHNNMNRNRNENNDDNTGDSRNNDREENIEVLG